VVKPPLRTKSLGTKVSDGEYAQLEVLASARGQTISELIRSVLLEQIAAPGLPRCSHRIAGNSKMPRLQACRKLE
jgi:hypothetical protein